MRGFFLSTEKNPSPGSPPLRVGDPPSPTRGEGKVEQAAIDKRPEFEALREGLATDNVTIQLAHNNLLPDLRLGGTEVTREVRTPLLAYTGDTSPAGLDAYQPAYEAKILITELSFIRPGHRRAGHHPHFAGRHRESGGREGERPVRRDVHPDGATGGVRPGRQRPDDAGG